MKRKLITLGALLFLILLGAFNSETENWPQFRGVNCSGLAAENAKPPVALTSQNLQWKTAISAGHSSPCIWGNNIFLSGCVEDEKKLMMYCGKTGRTDHPCPVWGEHSVGNLIGNSLIIDIEIFTFR